MAKVFIIEDNDGLRETVTSYLELDGHQVKSFARLQGVQEALDRQDPDLVILDVMLPDGDGFLFTRKLRQTNSVPIIFLTARTSESDRITGLEIGGDDYLIKPFSMKELMLRIKAILSRSGIKVQAHSDGTKIWTLANPKSEDKTNFEMAQVLEIHERSHTTKVNGKILELTGTEWKILSYLTHHEGMVLSRDRLLGACLDYNAEGSERTIDTHMKNLRAKLNNHHWIVTIRGYGYKFEGRAQNP